MGNPVTTAHPELLLAKGEEADYEWEVTANQIGYRCGYVRVPAGHPWHGFGYDDIEPYPEVHGGLTFAEPDTDCGKGGADNAWWLGFDCAHMGDAPDPALPGCHQLTEPYRSLFSLGTIRTTEYVIAQCRGLVRQAAEAEKTGLCRGGYRLKVVKAEWTSG